MNVGTRLQEVRKLVLEEHHRYYLAAESHPQGMALLRMLTRHPCGHVRWVIDWQACEPCDVCELSYHSQVIDNLLKNLEKSDV